METFLEMYLCSLLNMITADPSSNASAAVKASKIVAYAVFITFNAIVIYLAFLYSVKFKEIDSSSTYGALLAGTRVSTKRSRWILLQPAIFFSRRIAFVFSVLLLKTFLWAQLAIQFAFATAMLIYLLSVWPLESPFATKVEVVNECVHFFLLYGLMVFTDFVPDA